jgi:hypothetical protein
MKYVPAQWRWGEWVKGRQRDKGTKREILLILAECFIFVKLYPFLMIKEAKDIRKLLKQELADQGVFWSYKKPEPDLIPDDILIEKTLINLDIEDINKLFLIFPKGKIRKIWNEKVVINDAQFHSMNLLFALLYFKIKNPDSYLKKSLNKHSKALQLL